MMVELVDHALAGDFVRARAVHYRLLPLMAANFLESNPIPVKAVLALMGLIEESYRLPLTRPSDATRATLRALATELDLIDK
jgi:4-hydroxy-tetrahydrodipicolinate synthase